MHHISDEEIDILIDIAKWTCGGLGVLFLFFGTFFWYLITG